MTGSFKRYVYQITYHAIYTQLSLKHSDQIQGLSVGVLQTCAFNSGRIRPLFILIGVESTFRVAGWAIL